MAAATESSKWRFPSEHRIVRYLATRHPTRHLYLTNDKIIAAVANSFANRAVVPESIRINVLLTTETLFDADLSERAVALMQGHLTTALIALVRPRTQLFRRVV
ncbi:MAG: hypothetical protein RL235_1138 [Chlamydiota bacterium]|jgi:hypothetical protein